jgi:hypothetical protein
MFELIIKEKPSFDGLLEFMKGNEIFLSVQLDDYNRDGELMFDQQNYSLKNSTKFFSIDQLNIQHISEPEKFWMRLKYPTWTNNMHFEMGDTLRYSLSHQGGFAKDLWHVRNDEMPIADFSFRNWSFTPKRLATMHVLPDYPWLKMMIGTSWFAAFTMRTRRRS